MEIPIFFISYFLRDFANVVVSLLVLQAFLQDKVKARGSRKIVLFCSLFVLHTFGWAYMCYNGYINFAVIYYMNSIILPLFLVKVNRKIVSVLVLVLYWIILSSLSDVFRFLLDLNLLERTLRAHFFINFSEIAVNILVICYLLYRLKKKKEFYSFSVVKPVIFIVLIISLFFMTISQSLSISKLKEYQHNVFSYKIYYLILVVMMMILFFHLLKMNFSSVYHEETSKMLEEQINMQINHYQIFKEKEELLMSFQHDYKNMMMGLQSILKEGNMEQAIDYMGEMSSSFSSADKLFDSGNPIADALLLAKSRRAGEIDAKIIFDGVIPGARITHLHLCILLTNALDNAIEACSIIDGDKEIKIDSRMRKGLWFLTITNPVLKNVTVRDNRIQSTKQDKRFHGFGIRNMQTVLDTYEGDMKMSSNEKYFTLEMNLSLRD